MAINSDQIISDFKKAFYLTQVVQATTLLNDTAFLIGRKTLFCQIITRFLNTAFVSVANDCHFRYFASNIVDKHEVTIYLPYPLLSLLVLSR